MTEEMFYDEKVKLATTNQGLDPAVEALTAAGLPFQVEQTGGWCMVIYVYAESGQSVGITADDEEEPTGGKFYSLVGYADEEEHYTGGIDIAYGVVPSELAEKIRGWLR